MIDFLEKMGISPDSLHGKVAIVTGAARGIGKAVSETLAYAGATVVIADLSSSGVTIAESLQKLGARAAFIKTDVSNIYDLQCLIDETHRQFGGVDILINNAVKVEIAPVLEMGLDEWDYEYQTNLRAAVALSKGVLPGMLARKYGVIVNIISAEGMALSSPYSATKAGLKSFSLSLSKELSSQTGVSVFAFHPGMVETPLFDELAPKFVQWTSLPISEVIKNMATNPGYDGLMPPEHCAAALVKLILSAREYHGQVLDAFFPLASAGIIQFDSLPVIPHENNPKDGTHPIPNVVDTMSELIQHNQILELRINERTRALQEKTQQLSDALDELRSAELKLIESEKMAVLGHIVASITHEINTPAAVLLSNIEMEELLLHMTDFNNQDGKSTYQDRISEILSHNKSATLKIIDVVKSLKNFSRLDEATLKSVDLHEGLESTLLLLENQLAGRIEKQFLDLPPILCNAAQINQVFMNILLYRLPMLENYEDKIIIRTTLENGKAIVIFEDYGMSISQENLSKIFHPSFSVKNGKVGMDFGMALCYKIIEQHKGNILIKSHPHAATLFKVELPLQ